MKLSANTMTVLKNFAKINPNLKLVPGNVIRTVSPSSTVLAKATIEDEIDGSGAVYDTNRFLSVLSLIEEPTINFGENAFQIKSKNGKQKTSYTYAAENLMVTPPEDDIELTDPLATFRLSYQDLERLVNAAYILQAPQIVFESKDGTLTVHAMDINNPDSDRFTLDVDLDSSKDYSIAVSVDLLKLLPYDYAITLTDMGVVLFGAIQEVVDDDGDVVGERSPVQYWVASEATDE